MMALARMEGDSSDGPDYDRFSARRESSITGHGLLTEPRAASLKN
jgi:hypothetical protein